MGPHTYTRWSNRKFIIATTSPHQELQMKRAMLHPSTKYKRKQECTSIMSLIFLSTTYFMLSYLRAQDPYTMPCKTNFPFPTHRGSWTNSNSWGATGENNLKFAYLHCTFLPVLKLLFYNFSKGSNGCIKTYSRVLFSLICNIYLSYSCLIVLKKVAESVFCTRKAIKVLEISI